MRCQLDLARVARGSDFRVIMDIERDILRILILKVEHRESVYEQ